MSFFVDLRYANLSGVNLNGLTLEDLDLRWANLEGATLVGSILRRVDLTGANLRGADMTDANFFGSLLTGGAAAILREMLTRSQKKGVRK